MVILIVDDEEPARLALSELFKTQHEVLLADDGAIALETLKKNQVDLVITDHLMKKISGLEVIEQGKVLSPTTSFILVTAYGTVDDAVKSIKLGADDYLLKPVDFIELEHRVNRIEKLRTFKFSNLLKEQARTGLGRLIGESHCIEEARGFISKVADVNSCVLLLGPSGSGKEVLAQAIHETSSRSEHPFVAINCASLNDQFLESELFGHEKGAFTGALQAKPGKFELASGGTLFLDEIGELTVHLQAKLLRVLQEKEFFRMGGLKQIKADARILAATNRNLKEMVRAGTFREDLYFRLNVLTFELLPLSQRKEDIPHLIHFFWKKFQQDLGCKSKLSQKTIEKLQSYSFPGNVRELQNVLERLAVLGAKDSTIEHNLLPPEFLEAGTSSSVLPLQSKTESDADLEMQLKKGLSLSEIVEKTELKIIELALKETRDNQVQTAKKLKISRGTLQYKLKKYRN